VTEREPSLRLIELERRQPEIEQDAIEWCNPSVSGNDAEIGKVGVDRDKALADAWVLSQLERAVNCGGIGIEGENDPVWRRRIEQRPAMTAASEGTVQVRAACA
jgi:hypothetical protein